MSLEIIRAVKIIKNYTTLGSRPLLVQCEDASEYVIKTTQRNVPRAEIINEVLSNGFFKCWNIPQPDIVLVHVPKEVVREFTESDGRLNSIYDKTDFESELFFGSKKYLLSDDLFSTESINKAQYKKFRTPIDLIKIGTFDYWVGNKDRKPQNPNILISTDENGLLYFIPIDHTAAFAYYQNYRDLRKIHLEFTGDRSILSTGLARSILKFTQKDTLKSIDNEFLSYMKLSIDNFDDISELVPKEWGFSEKARSHLRSLLGDQERNKLIAEKFRQFIP